MFSAPIMKGNNGPAFSGCCGVRLPKGIRSQECTDADLSGLEYNNPLMFFQLCEQLLLLSIHQEGLQSLRLFVWYLQQLKKMLWIVQDFCNLLMQARRNLSRDIATHRSRYAEHYEARLCCGSPLLRREADGIGQGYSRLLSPSPSRFLRLSSVDLMRQ